MFTFLNDIPTITGTKTKLPICTYGQNCFPRRKQSEKNELTCTCIYVSLKTTNVNENYLCGNVITPQC